MDTSIKSLQFPTRYEIIDEFDYFKLIASCYHKDEKLSVGYALLNRDVSSECLREAMKTMDIAIEREKKAPKSGYPYDHR